MNETDIAISRITDAAIAWISSGQYQPVLDAIDAAMSLAYAEGRSDQAEEQRGAYAKGVAAGYSRGRLDFEKAARLMNESGQGEHMGVTK